jgi:outer membrane protein assembly factor BamB
MLALALALALAAPVTGARSALPTAPLRLWTIAWMKPLLSTQVEEWNPLQSGGPAIDPVTGIVVVGTHDGWLHAFRRDGGVAWEFRGAGPFDGTPAIDGDTVYAGSSGGPLYAIAIATGKARWSYDAKEELATRPAVADGVVYVASLQDTVFAVDARTGAWRWQHRRERKEGFTIHGAAPAIVRGDTLYTAYSDGTVAALDRATGAVRWEKQVGPRSQFHDVDGIDVEGARVYAAAYSGSVVALDAATGRIAWEAPAKEASRVAVFPGTVVAVTTTSVVALSPSDGTVLWTSPLEGAPRAAPVRAGARLLVPAGSGGMRVLDLASGRTLRVLQTGSGVAAGPAVLGRRAYVLSNGGEFLALDLE